MSEPTVRAFSFGGGVQSTACLVLAAQRVIDFPLFIFANTGDDSENPATLEYIETIARPYAEAHGIEIITVVKRKRDSTVQTLYQHCMSRDNRTIALPVRMPNGAPGNRKCTVDWKIRPVAKETKRRGAMRHTPAVIGIGISWDESHRAKDSLIPYQTTDFPLLWLTLDGGAVRPRRSGERGLDRGDCKRIISAAGLAVPTKSSCWFCPYKKISEWRQMLTDDPERFNAAVELELELQLQRKLLGKDTVYLSNALKPLNEAIVADGQLKLPLEDECSGYCWT